MAKLKMKKIELIALLTDSKKIIELIQRRGVVEICKNQDDDLPGANVNAIIAEFEKFRNTAAMALEITEKYAPEKAGLASMIEGRREIDTDSLGREAVKLEVTMDTAREIIACNKLIADSQVSKAQLSVKVDTLKQWSSLDVPMNFKGTATTKAFIGTVPYAVTGSEFEEKLPSSCSAEVVSSFKDQTNLFILCSNGDYEETADTLRRLSFTALSDTESKRPSELMTEYESQAAKLEKSVDNAVKKIIELSANRDQLKFTVDYLQMRKEKYEALSSLGFTSNTFVLTGYVPEKYVSKLQGELESKFKVAIFITDPKEDEEVPVLLENSKFSEPVEGITKMYAMPNRSDVDPTPVMSFFYYLFFGMMLSDAGYGLLMVIGTTLAIKKFNLEKSMKKTLIMFRNCGISTVFWGALFGSWFGDIVQTVAREFFGKNIGSIALWFEPINDPIKLLLYSFALGILHLFLGVGVSFKMAWDDGRKLDAVLDTVPVYLTILGVAPIGASIFTNVPSSLKTVGSYVMTAGVVLIVLTAGRSSKNIFARFFGGVYALYNTATGYLSDILSYSRLLALGLATGSIASVINLMAVMPENKVVKLIMFIIVGIVGHTANLAINLLGAYVHTDRLQFVEFFSKFYTGGGKEFEPLTVNTKYIKLKEENSND